MINRKQLITKHNPKITHFDTDSPLTVGNGNFAFTVDATGTQSFNNHYEKFNFPLCTMTSWAWHKTPFSPDEPNPTLTDLTHTEYSYNNRKINLPVEKKAGEEKIYDWLRENPHRPNLVNIGFYLDQKPLDITEVTNIKQELHLFTGNIQSEFTIREKPVRVTTVCHMNSDVLAIQVTTQLENLELRLKFPYPGSSISGSDWLQPQNHKSTITHSTTNRFCIFRQMDDFEYNILLNKVNYDVKWDLEKHEVGLVATDSCCEITVGFYKKPILLEDCFSFEDILSNNIVNWKDYWMSVGLVDFSGSTTVLAYELERRVILSLYLLRIQSAGYIPPQETGLTCNSWHGKFHLEMHFWHSAWLALYNQGALLEKSFLWYEEIFDKARANAFENGFLGVRWPKQVGIDGTASPSPISPLLIWQQPHLIYMLELLFLENNNKDFLQKYWYLVKGTADFMCDFVVFDEVDSLYHIVSPVIPAQEEFDPLDVKNPTFELEYWNFVLGIALKWANRLGFVEGKWEDVFNNLANSIIIDGVYLSHENCPDTFKSYAKDHPMMLAAFGVIPGSRMNSKIMKNTLDKVLNTWDFDSMWGWDFAVMALAATKVGLPELAVEILLLDSSKNNYVTSGNNYQRTRTDLPLYLPGNGSLLYAVAGMVAGFENEDILPGIPLNNEWKVKFENIRQLPK